MYCKNCGSYIEPDQRVCPKCGEKIGKTKKKKGTIIPVVIILVVALVVFCAIGYGISYVSSPKSLMFSNLSHIVDDVFSQENEQTKFIENTDRVQVDGSASLEFPASLNLGMDSLQLDFGFLQNRSVNRLQGFIDLQSNEESLFSIDTVLADNRVYFTLAQVFDEYYYMNFDMQDLFQVIGREEYENLFHLVIDNVKKNITDQDFQREKVTITLDEQEIKVTENTLEVSKEKMIEIYQDIITAIRNDESAIEVLEKLMGLSKEEVLSDLDDSLKELREDPNYVPFYFRFYVKGMNQVVLTSLEQETTVFKYYQGEDKKITLESGEVTIASADWDDNGVEITIDTQEGNRVYWKQTKDSLTVEIDGASTIRLTGELQMEKVSDKEYRNAFNGTIEVDGISFPFVMNLTVSEGTEIDLTAVDQAKDIEQLTEEEQMEFLTKLQQLPIVQLFLIQGGF